MMKNEKPDLHLKYDKFRCWVGLTADRAIIDTEVHLSEESYHCRIDDNGNVRLASTTGNHTTTGSGLLYTVIANLKANLGCDLEDVQLASDRKVYIKPVFYDPRKEDPWKKVIEIARDTLGEKFNVTVTGYPSLD